MIVSYNLFIDLQEHMAAQVVWLAGNQVEYRRNADPPPSQHAIMPEISTRKVDVTPELKRDVPRRPVLKTKYIL